MTARGPEDRAAGMGADEVHVWRASLRASEIASLVLSDEELHRAAGLRFERDRYRYLAAHGFLRDVLAGYLGVEPHEVSFRFGPSGKPSLLGESDFRFNLSHSEDIALLAIGRRTEIGVDVEGASLIVDPEAVARRSMSDEERRRLDGLPSERRSEAILATWVRKEAVAKGLGDGLAVDLTAIGTLPDQPASGTAVTVATSPPDHWFVWDIPVGPNRAGALALPRDDVSVRILDHPDLGRGALPSPATSASLTP